MAQTRQQSNNIENLKVPPHSVEAEKAVIGGLLLVSSAWDRVSDRLSEEDFYHKNHRLIYQAIKAINRDANACDVVTVSDWLISHKLDDQTGGLEYLAEIAGNTAGAANIEAHADIVREKSILRQLIEIGSQLTEKGFNSDGEASGEILEAAEKMVFQIREQTLRTRSGFQNIEDVLSDTIEVLEKLTENEGDITGLPYGFNDLDDLTSGLQRSDLIIVAGRPAMGKTSFSMNIAEKAAIKYDASVAIFSMEMSAVQLVMRMFSSLARINQRNLRSGRIRDEEWPRIGQAQQLLHQSKLFIDDTPALSPAEVRARARRLKRKHGLDLIVIDYLQLMQVPGNNENLATEISEISRTLKAIAKELDVPVIALSQLNRSLEQRPNKRPVMSDLRESGAIEQDADLIIFIYRDEVYNEDSPHKGKAEIIVGKHRNGATGTVPLTFLGEYTRFENFQDDIVIDAAH